MATNPITSESLTVDFRSLMKIPVRDRIKAASVSQDFLQSILSALTPIQIANAFPDYYKRQLPDVSNFVTSYITSRNGGNFDQTGGGDQGYEPTYFDGEDKPKGKRPSSAPEPTIEEMKKKLIEQGIDVEGTYAALGSGTILENDERFGYLQKMSDEELKAAGMQRIQDEYGKTLINLLPTEASTLTKEEVLSRASNNTVPGTTGLEGRAALAKQTYDAFIEAGVSDKQARALVAEVNRENSLRPEYVFGTHTEVAAQAGGRTNYGMFSWGDPSRVKNFKKYMQENGVLDPAGNLIADNSTYLKHQAKFAVQEMQGYKAGREFLENKEVSVEDGTKLLGKYIGWDMAGRRHDASASYERLREGRKIIDEVNDKMSKILPENATDEQIEEAREILDQKEREGRADALIRQQFDKASPTSSEFIQAPSDDRNQTIVNEHGYSAPVTGTMMHEGHGRTSEFGYGRGRLHAGVDIYSTDPETGQLRVGSNAPVTAPMDAKVTMIMKDRGRAGNYIEIQDKNGNRHRFLHTDKTPALNPTTGEPWKVGESITQGQTITNITGSGTKFDQKVKELDGDINAAVSYFDQNGWGSVNKPHLHYEVRDSRGKLLDPSTIFPEYSGENKEDITFSNRNDKLKHLLVTGQITKDDYDKQMQNDPKVSAKQEDTKDADLENTTKNKKPLSIIEYSRPTEDADLENTTKNKKPLSIIEYSRPTEDAEAAPTTTSAPEPVTTENTLFVGDSIAQGLRDAAQGQGNTKVGRNPSEVLSEMEKMGPESFKGKRVILSTGLSNNTQDLESVRKQLEFLKTAGADVQIAGMSNSRKDLAPGNQQLQQLSSEYGYKFMGGFDAGKDKIHPTNYNEYAVTAAEAIQIAEAATSVEAPAPVTEQQAEVIYDGRRELFQTPETPEVIYDGRRELFQTPETPEVIADGRRELFQTPETPEVIADVPETPEIIYDGRRELFQTPEAAISPTPVESAETIAAEIPAPVETKETIAAEIPAPVESKESIAAEIPVASVETKETTAATPPPPPEEVRKYALGGNIYEPNEDMTLVDTETGNPIAQIGNDEKIEKTGNAIQVTPETKLKAEELTNKYDSSNEMEDRMSDIEDNLQNQKPPDTTNQIMQKAREPEKTQTESPHRWRESLASAERPVSPSFNRAMARSKFFGEGHHFTRSAPGSQS